MEKKVQKNTQFSFWWKGKSSIQTKKIRRQSSGKKFKFAASVLFELGWHCLSSQLFAAVSTPNIAELVLFCFFCPQPWFLRRFRNTFCQEKHQHFHADRQLVTKTEISIKINLENDKKRLWPSGLISDFIRRRPGFEQEFFSFVFSFVSF